VDHIFRVASDKVLSVNEIVQLHGHFGGDDLEDLSPQQAAIDRAYQAALALIADGPAKTAGLSVGEKAAEAILALRSEDGAATRETYRPHTTPGLYVPTVIPVAPQWPQRTPWLMASPAQFRPPPPPALTSAVWARDYNEVKAFGSKDSTQRTAEQTAIARFWEATMPPIYHDLVRSVATMPGREVTQNARLFAAVTQATDDALIAVLEAKYYYNFWTLRNGSRHGRRLSIPPCTPSIHAHTASSLAPSGQYCKRISGLAP
jgi:hypothetical protein